MRELKKPLAAAGIVCVAFAVSLLSTWLSAVIEDEPDPLPERTHVPPDNAGYRQIDWDSLPDAVVAWIEVPGANIDEPIVQATSDDPNAYLYVDALGQGAYGTPYIDCECKIDSRFVVVYGHHMSDGSVFADFASFIDEGYAREHDEIIVFKRNGEVLNLHPVSVDIVNATWESLVIDQKADFSETVAGSDLIIRESTEEGQLFAFITCSYQRGNSRTVVYVQDRVERNLQSRSNFFKSAV